MHQIESSLHLVFASYTGQVQYSDPHFGPLPEMCVRMLNNFNVFQAHANDLITDLSTPDVQGIYETQISLEFR